MAQDDEDAKPLVLSSAAISFSHVTHEYTPGNPVLRDVTFSVPGGSTTALVRRSTACPTLILPIGTSLSEARDPSVRRATPSARQCACSGCDGVTCPAAAWQ